MGRGKTKLCLPPDPPEQTLSRQRSHWDPRTSALLQETLTSQLNLPQSFTQGQARTKASVFRYQIPLLRRNEKYPRATRHDIFQTRKAGV